jgi:aspartyl/glutamyl-tRNA(Asn/Gln) amidotransferase C subunit
MANSKINISGISKLANFQLTAGEKQLYEKQLSVILDYVKQIESVKTKNTNPTFNVTININVTRKDNMNKSITQIEAISNAQARKDGFIVSKGVFENE